MMKKNYKNLINAMFSLKGRYPNAIIVTHEYNNDISISYRIDSIGYDVHIQEQYDNNFVYTINVYMNDDIIAKYEDYDIRKFEDIEHLYIRLVKVLRGDI